MSNATSSDGKIKVKDPSRIFSSVLAAVVAFGREVGGVVLRSRRVGQARGTVRRLGVEGVVPEQGEEGLEPVGILAVSHKALDLDLDLDHNLQVGHLGEVGHSRAHVLQEVDLDQGRNFLEGQHSLRVDGLLVELVLIVN
jgi:hypothetical protein